jgi:hypothetical protein
MKRYSNILARFNVPLSTTARILDFGCGAGRTVYHLLDQGYDAFGYDVNDYLELRRACLKTLKPTSNKEKEAKFAVLNA